MQTVLIITPLRKEWVLNVGGNNILMCHLGWLVKLRDRLQQDSHQIAFEGKKIPSLGEVYNLCYN